MNQDPYGAFVEEDLRFHVGMRVTAHWNHCGFSYQGHGEIVGLTQRSVAVKLLEPVGRLREYAADSVILVPRIADNVNWSTQNCARPERSDKGWEAAGWKMRSNDFF